MGKLNYERSYRTVNLSCNAFGKFQQFQFGKSIALLIRVIKWRTHTHCPSERNERFIIEIECGWRVNACEIFPL